MGGGMGNLGGYRALEPQGRARREPSASQPLKSCSSLPRLVCVL